MSYRPVCRPTELTPSATKSKVTTLPVPVGATHVAIENDGGHPVFVHPSGSPGGSKIRARTGQVIPVDGRDVGFSVDATLATAVGGAQNIRVVMLDAQSALLWALGNAQARTDENRRQAEVLIAAAPARILTFPFGTLAVSLRSHPDNAGRIHVSNSDFAAGNAIPLDPGDPMNWAGPLWARCDGGANCELIVVPSIVS